MIILIVFISVIIVLVIAILGVIFNGKDEYGHDNISEKTTAKVVSVLFYVLIIWIVLGVLSVACLVVVPAGYTGIYHLFGKVSVEPLSSGLHIKNPLATVTEMEIRTRKHEISLKALTKDSMEMTINLVINCSLREEEAPRIFRNIGENYGEKVIIPPAQEAIREVVSQYTMEEVYAGDLIKNDITEKTKRFIEKDKVVVVEKVAFVKPTLPREISAAITEKMKAKQEAEKMTFLVEKERKEKEITIIEAEAIREAQDIINSTLTPEYLTWHRVEILWKMVKENPDMTLFVDIDAVPDGQAGQTPVKVYSVNPE